MAANASPLDPDANPGPAHSAASADKGLAGGAAILHAAEADALPTPFGVFKPVGHVMTGMPAQAQIDTLVSALQDQGLPRSGMQQFAPSESVAELQAMVDSAGPMAGFGYEITLHKRYLALAEQGYKWLLVQAEDSEQAAAVAEAARQCRAPLAVYYRRFTVEEPIA